MDQQNAKQRRFVLGSMLAVHVLIGVVAASFSNNQPTLPTGIFVSIIFGQATLVGIWAGLGRSHWVLRLLGVALSTLLFCLLCGFAFGVLEAEVVELVLVCIGIVAIVTWGMRLFKCRLGQLVEESAATREGLQFTIKHLLTLTFVVACLLTIGKLSAPYWETLNQATSIFVLGLCFVTVSLSSLWAMLGSSRPILRSLPVIAIAGSSGWVAGFVLSRSSGFISFWIVTMLLNSVILLLSLGVMRWCGYRLVANR